MHCPFCTANDTKVVDSRLVSDGYQVRRRRECASCHTRITTYETVELTLPRVKKQDGSYVQFNEAKLRNGIIKALEKRPISQDTVEKIVSKILVKVKTLGERDISSMFLGEWVMEELKNVDKVAYVRFASVYRKFEDIEAFKHAIEDLND